MVQTSGAIAPIEAMPPFFQVLSLLNPLRHYIRCWLRCTVDECFGFSRLCCCVINY
ncbi:MULTISPECIES: hypothetical protein [unclassified Nostoc]|uniref:hypothetical protein n=1 Tax=unclassified Nostoc TaxID=2593658 RepID=UPI002AD44327|nr:hypothetical protein [Nostoc sp. DedQUE03]MDZ7971692.1 hypothetical protein [Nostoc sp. DedQUE03]MDZ8046439.1 hypothetical protein [Nostoc sp. DedQUE02]